MQRHRPLQAHRERAVDALRSRIRSFLRLTSSSPGQAPVVHEVIRDNGFARKLISYSGSDGDAVQAFLFEPAGKRSDAAVIALHQHNSDWTLGKSEIAGLSGDSLQAFGPALARAGIAVLAPDMLGFESRRGLLADGKRLDPKEKPARQDQDAWLQYYNHAMHRLVRGELLITKMLEDIGLATDAVQELAGASRVGIAGHSFGGNLALFAAALDTRLAFACVSGAACSYRHKLGSGTGLELALAIPDFATHFDFDDLMSCVAPRKLFVVSSEDDPYAADAPDLVTKAVATFEASGTREHLQHLHVSGPHALDRERHEAIVKWLVKCSSDSG